MQNIKIQFLNTVWSDAILLSVDGHFALIDTASKFYFPMVKDTLDTRGVKCLDFILLTHFHKDHYGNIINVLENYKVKKVYFREYSHHDYYGGDGNLTNEDYIKAETAAEQEIMQKAQNLSKLIILDENGPKSIKLGGLKLELYNLPKITETLYNEKYLLNKEENPIYHLNRLSENHLSVPIYFEVNGHSVYLGADMCDNNSEIEEISRMNFKIVKKVMKKHHLDHFDIYKTPHHGGSGSNYQDIFEVVKPNFAVITNTDKWLDVWPTRSNILAGNPNCELLQTDRYQYLFDLSTEKIKLYKISDESLFITLNKD